MVRWVAMGVVLAVATAPLSGRPARRGARRGARKAPVKAAGQAAAPALPAYKTTVPAITADRWRKKPPPIPEPRTITREDYRALVQEHGKRFRPARLAQADNWQQGLQELWARREAFDYRVTGDEQHARAAMRFLRTACRYWTEGPGGTKHKCNARQLIAVGNAYRAIRRSRSLTQADHATVRRLLHALMKRFYNWEQGAHNRGTAGAGAVMIFNHLVPNAATRQAYVQKVWDQWWAFRDSFENSAGYNALWFADLISVLVITEQESVLADPAMKKLAERYLAQVTPVGAMPGHGDVTGFNSAPGRWISVMEKWAAVYKDGRFRWAAHRLMEFMQDHKAEYERAGLMDSFIEHFIDAYEWADESIAEQEPTTGSTVTYRKGLRKTSHEVEKESLLWAELTQQTIPNKLIFRTGWRAADTYAMVELCPPIGHGHVDAGSINCLTSRGSVLLADTPYLIKDPRFHNAFVLLPDQRPKGWRWHEDAYYVRQAAISVEDFHAGQRVGYARVHITRYRNQPATLDRRVFFLGDDGLWVRDTLAVAEPFRGRAGPAFQFVGVYPKRGDHWVNACQTSLPAAAITLPYYMIQLTNRPWDLLVYAVPRYGAKLVIDDVTHDDTRLLIPDKALWNNFTRRVWHQRRGVIRPGRAETFDSVLVPHKPTPDASPWVQRIELLPDTGAAAVLKQGRPGRRTVWAGINGSGQAIQAGRIATDAKWFVVHTQRGRTTYYWVVDATSLKVDGRDVFTATQHSSKEKRIEQDEP